MLERAELTDDGLVLGAGTVLAGSSYGPDDAAGHDRLVALLATAHGGCVHAAVPSQIAKALVVWRGGDRALAACHLALARLPPVGPDEAYRLFLAALALDEGIAPAVLLREIGAPAETCSDAAAYSCRERATQRRVDERRWWRHGGR